MNIALTMIVKNEAHCIARAIRSVRPFISSYSISDTGSIDSTKQIITEELADVPGVLSSDTWVDFSTNRNIALSRVTGDYAFTLDADEILHGPLLISDQFDAFRIRIDEGDDIEFLSTRVVRNDGLWHWEGGVHESVYHPGSPTIATLAGAHITTPHDGAQSISGNKFEGHIAYFEQAEKTPRNVFYHAQALFGAGRYEEAIVKYTERAKMGGDEEVYYSAYQAGLLKCKLGRNAIPTLLKAYAFRPSRYEALAWACMLLRRQGEHEKAYMFSSVIPRPTQDVIFVERSAEWRILEEHALASASLGLISEAIQFFEYALQYDLPEAHRARMERSINTVKEVVQ